MVFEPSQEITDGNFIFDENFLGDIKMLNTHVIFGIHITGRLKHISSVQQLLTEYGCNIKTRLGLHEAGEGFCSPNGLMVLEMVGEKVKCDELFDKLNALGGIEVKKMVFEHP